MEGEGYLQIVNFELKNNEEPVQFFYQSRKGHRLVQELPLTINTDLNQLLSAVFGDRTVDVMAYDFETPA